MATGGKMQQLILFYDSEYELSLKIEETVNMFLETNEDVEYIKLNVSDGDNTDLITKYGIDSAPTLVGIKDDGSFKKHKQHVIVPEIEALFD